MKRASIVLLLGILGSTIVPGTAFAQTASSTMGTQAQLTLILQLLQQLYALQLQLLQLQRAQNNVVVLPAPTSFGSDLTSPIVSNFSSTATQTSMTIKWATDEDTKATIEWWAPFYRKMSWSETAWAKTHSKVIGELTTGIVYSVRITARDGSGNTTVYPDQLVKTIDAPDKIKPTISSVKVTNITNSSAVVGWKTNEKAKTKLYYGTVNPLKTSATTTKSVTDTSFTLDHLVFLSGLENGRVYYFIIEATDGAGNKMLSAQDDFSTLWR